ncbi:hypothetical protein BDP27DRAFT_1416761 [Rhodocollybia butyracea]|uniref:Uncharacterized protein n=1 Tax=Rhodocollybia butyracea TaxID=206335 RepID=A0A9P5Q4T0_9AGAR|nr:hypothetical protein BDP27DRAFT_1416761 [Rhodocollybia butyracea]
MFLTHHWLRFILLAVLMSPACAAPLERRDVKYKLKSLDKHGDLVMIPMNAPYELNRCVIALATEMGDGNVQDIKHEGTMTSNAVFDPSIMLYYKLMEGRYCRVPYTCYGSVVTPPKDKNPQEIMFGTIISHTVIPRTKKPRYYVFHQPFPAGISGAQLKSAKELREELFFEFLTEFALVRPWLMRMAFLETEHATLEESDSEVVIKAGNLVRKKMDMKTTVPT